MNGTYSYCPRFFTQPFTFFGIKNGICVPLFFFLLTSKTSDAYNASVSLIKLKSTELGVTFEPKKTVVDYEPGILLAMKKSLDSRRYDWMPLSFSPSFFGIGKFKNFYLSCRPAHLVLYFLLR